jgi:lipopolysaccharide transport system ATP-binding protein
MSDSDVVIRVEGLGKKYALHHETSERYTALRDVVARQAKAAGRLLNPFTLSGQLRKAKREAAQVRAESEEEFWALKDVSFEIRRGERVGIIGRNGAGKSTLLKILSRITEPTTGRVEIYGRVASLLEVGTGFHPELTGRENIYLNGAILGMMRREIRGKFDEIVDFAEVEKFLDTPVKRYSSGMYVRLAFAVAAHLEPEILVVDEVLAVGDASFQKKCLGKMGEITSEGERSLFFVSHNLHSVSSLCSSALLLSDGELEIQGSVKNVIDCYLSKDSSSTAICFPARPGKASITSVKIDKRGLMQGFLRVSISFLSPFSIRHPVGGIVLRSSLGEVVWGTNNRFHPALEPIKAMSNGTLKCNAGRVPLRSGSYILSAWLGDWDNDLDSAIDCLVFTFGEESESVLMPSTPSIGHLMWNAEWSAA